MSLGASGRLGRRALLAGTGAGLISASTGAARAQVVTGRAPLPFAELANATCWPLWPGQPPGGLRPGGTFDGPPRIVHRGALAQIATPFVSVFRPERPNGSAMLVSGGGGYKFIEMLPEALPAARWLTSLGITAFVLGYRLPDEGWAAGGLAPLADAQRAIRLIRARADSLGLDRKRVGGMGFSAGGHLTALAATCPDWRAYAPIDEVDHHSDRLDLALLAYPVITIEAPYQTTSTARVLLGGDPSPANAARWSVQTHVRPGDPPVFMVQAEDDQIASPDNTAIMEQACQRAGVPCERHLYANGRHGFGMGRPGTQSVDWPIAGRAWLARQGFTAA